MKPKHIKCKYNICKEADKVQCAYMAYNALPAWIMRNIFGDNFRYGEYLLARFDESKKFCQRCKAFAPKDKQK